MVHHCCVPKCTSSARSPSSIAFHSFPTDVQRRKQWLHSVRRDARKTLKNPSPFVVNKHTKVCSKHFKDDDYLLGSSRRQLALKAVPSVFAWSAAQNIRSHRATKQNFGTRVAPALCHEVEDLVEINNVEGPNLEATVGSSNQDIADTADSDSIATDILVDALPDTCQGGCKINTDLIIENMQLREELKKWKGECQVQSTSNDTQVFGIDSFKSDDSQMAYYTGFPSYAIFMIAFEFLLPSRCSSGVVQRNIKSDRNNKNQRKLSPHDEFFLFLVKLRQSFGYRHLGFLFKISASSACRTFTSWLSFSYLRLGSLTIWPHRDILISNALPSFREKYPNTLCSIDCTEIFIHTPSSLVRQSQCYSTYKSNTKLKGPFAVDPNGGIIFISQLWTGCVSDRKIIVDSGFASEIKRLLDIGHILPGDVILADKGFKVGDLLKPVQLNLPAFRVTGQQFSPEDVEECRRIAAERIHVERAISRIKSFKILSGDLPVSLLGSVNQIWTVCCLLTNFRNPLIKDNGEFAQEEI